MITKAMGTLIIAAALLSQDADAQSDRSASFFVPVCQSYLVSDSKDDSLASLFHQGECQGIIDGLSFVSEELPPDFRSCLPAGVTNEQMVRAVLAYTERHPHRMHEDFRGFVIDAWHEAWPCN
jgi:hypothetical protein